RIDQHSLGGRPQIVCSPYFFKLPCPKRDVDESIRVLSALVKTHPNNWRGKIYLADSLADDDKPEQARKLVQEVLDAPGGQNPPEEKRLKELARKWMNSHGPVNTAQ